MTSNSPSRDPTTFLRDPRSIPPRRISHYGNSSGVRRMSQNKESRKDDPGGGRTKRKDTEEDDSDAECYNFEKLKGFHIPRKKGQEEKELLKELLLNSREYTHTIFPSVRSSFFDPQANRKLTINQVELVQNPKLEKEYLNKKRDLKDEGRSDKDLADSFGFLHVFKRKEVEKICKEGVSIGHSNLQTLGKPEMGVYICKHADIVRLSRWEENQAGYIIMFKIIKGRIKLVPECRTPPTDQEPTPLYDCHVTKLPIDIAQSLHARAYQTFQYYLYEYGDVDVVERPRQVLPYAVLKYTYDDLPTSVGAASRISRRESSTDETGVEGNSGPGATSSLTGDGFCHWRGKLLVKNGTFCSVEIRSWLDTVFNVANIDRSINIKTCLSLDKLKRQLPPTLLSKSAKKYNVIYRGRHYNTFTLHPTEEGSGLGKFRQLIGHLVQRSVAAFVPLRNNSSLYLLPLSGLTEEMGLRGSSPDTSSADTSKQSHRAWKNFLHVIIITPKALSSKINDQRVFNIIHVRKRKESGSAVVLSSVRDGLEQKLRLMNIDASSALSSMEPEQHYKIFGLLKDKKKLQTSEKMLHSFYKDADILSPTRKDDSRKGLSLRWMDNTKLQQEFYSAKKKTKVIQSPTSVKRSRSASRGSMEEPSPCAHVEESSEATFSDDEESPSSKQPTPPFKIPKKQPRLDDPRTAASIINVPLDGPEPPSTREQTKPKPKHPPFQYTPAPRTKTPAGASPSILRPSFKPLEELIFSENLEELMKHPEFSFTEKHCINHTVSSFTSPLRTNSPYTPWEEGRPQISVTFTQEVPYVMTGADCPFALEGDSLILSMLRAIHGNYDGSVDTPEEHSKVEWVRRVLHTRGRPPEIAKSEPDTAASQPIPGLGGVERKIVESVDDKVSPQVQGVSPHQNSTDSGFVSSSAAATPSAVPDSPSLKEIAAILATALTQSKAPEPGPRTSVPEVAAKQDPDSPDMEAAAKVLLKALAQSAEEDSKDSQSIEEGEITSHDNEDFDGTDMELGSTPGCSPMRDIIVTGPDGHTTQLDPSSGGSAAAVDKEEASGKENAGYSTASHPQDPRMRKGPSHLPPSHPPSRAMKTKEITRTVKELRRVIPGLTAGTMKMILQKILPIASKHIKSLGKKTLSVSKTVGTVAKPKNPTSEANTIQRPWATTTMTSTGPRPAKNSGDVAKLTITVKSQKEQPPETPAVTQDGGATTSDAAVSSSLIGTPDVDRKKRAGGDTLKPMNLTLTGSTIKKLGLGQTFTRDPRVATVEATSSDPRKADRRNKPGLGCSATTQITKKIWPRLVTSRVKDPPLGRRAGQASSAALRHAFQGKATTSGPTMQATTISTIITRRKLKGDSPQEFLPTARIGTIITPRDHTIRPHREADRDCLTQVTPVLGQDPEPFYPEPTLKSAPRQGGPAASASLSPAWSELVALGVAPFGDSGVGQGGMRGGGNTISKQNSELFHNILSFLSKEANPAASAAAVSVAQQVPMPSSGYESPQPVPPVEVTGTQAMDAASSTSQGLKPSEVNDILRRLIRPPDGTPDRSPGDGSSMAAPKQYSNKSSPAEDTSPLFTGASGSLSLSDIQRIREKKQRLNEKKAAERELCRREAMYMRDELNKSIERRARQQPQKKLKRDRHGKPSTSRSPESTSSGTSAESNQPNKDAVKPAQSPQKITPKPGRPFGLDQPASTQVLSDVAFALSDSKSGFSASSSVAATRPTGVVTPTPRPVHPVFMQSANQFPLVEVSPSLRGTSMSSAESTAQESDPSQVISEIDNTLSQLKQGMQANRNDNELKDSMAKLLQLVLRLGGASTDEPSQSSSPSLATSAASLSRFLSGPTNALAMSSAAALPQSDLRNTLNARNAQVVWNRDDSHATSSSLEDASLSRVVDSHTFAFRSSLRDIPADYLDSTRSTNVFNSPQMHTGEISGGVSAERDTVVQNFRSHMSAPNPSSSTARPKQRDIDDILNTLRPFIENLNKSKTSTSDVKRPVSYDESSSFMQRGNEDGTSGANISSVSYEERVHGSVDAREGSQKRVEQTARSSTNPTIVPDTPPFLPSTRESTGVHASQGLPVPVKPLADMDTVNHPPASVPAANRLVPLTGMQVHNDMQPVVVAPSVLSSSDLPVPPPSLDDGTCGGVAIPTRLTSRTVSSPQTNRSECGTPTLDERYPSPAPRKKRKRRNATQTTNSFIVFDPHSSPDCEAIRLYLIQVKGMHFDVHEMSDKIQEQLRSKDETRKEQSTSFEPATLDNELLCSLLPPGNLWVVCRTVDLKNLSQLSHLSLLKCAGTRVQFVCADSVREVRARQYKCILEGDGGIVVPLCPKTLLSKAVIFRHLMLWLTGQRGDSRGKNRWRIALHQHMLDAIQAAEDSEDALECENADQVLDWLCHAEKNKAKLAVGLPEHSCDSCPDVDPKDGARAWNWYDAASPDEIAKAALSCAMNLQHERVSQCRHIVLLVESDPVAPCWQPLWQSGICVSTIERFVDLVCSKPAGSSTQQPTSCILPLYTLGSAWL